ncbi:MAG: DNA gyrase subunit A, partial [Lachnospiraceae bacterium]|nr:DNA gyrase subunit A [Lachnospiraceae bacterium]
LLMTTTHHSLNFFTTAGRVYRMKAYEIPECSRTSRGVAIVNLLQLEPGEKVSAIIPIWGFEEGKNLFIATKNGTVKKMKMDELINVRKSGLRAITLVDGNELIDVKITDADSEILLATKQGMCIRFREEEVRTTGRGSIGVIGMNLSDGDEVVAMQLASQGKYLTFISEKGMGKRTDIDEFNGQHRAGKGVKCYKITDKTGDLLAAKAVNGDEELIMITDGGQMIRIRIDDISILSRITSGVKLMNLPDGEKIANVAKVRDRLSNGEKEFASLEEGEEEMDKESESMASSFDSDDDDEEVTLPTEDNEEDE